MGAIACYTISLVTVVITIRSSDLIQQSVGVRTGELAFWRAMSHIRTAATLLGWCLSITTSQSGTWAHHAAVL